MVAAGPERSRMGRRLQPARERKHRLPLDRYEGRYSGRLPKKDKFAKVEEFGIFV